MDQLSGVSATEETLAGQGGVDIFLRSWRPDGPATAIIVICHGFNAHSGQYAWVAGQLVNAGFSVYAPDLRGRGRSEGERFYVENVADYVADVSDAIRIANERNPGLPVFLLGHSAGGVIGALYALDNPSKLAGFICESFAFQVPAPNFAIAAIRWLSRVAPHLPILALKNENFSRDPKTVEALNTDPLIAHETQPARTVAALADADDRLRNSFPEITIPVLIMHGTDDKVTVCKGSEFFYENAGSKDKTLKLYEGHYHDLLADTGREEVIADITEWIEKRLPA